MTSQPKLEVWHYAAIVASSSDAIISKDLQGLIASWNPGAEAIFGYSQAEVLGQPITILLPEERRAEEAHVMAEIRLGKTVPSFDTIRRRKDGSLVDVSVTVSPIFDEAGAIVGGSQIARDISKRKKAEEDLRVSLKEIGQLKAALDEHAIVAVTDRRGDITYVNDKFCSISKYSREELLGQNHRIINSGHHPRQFFVDLWSTISHGRIWKGEIKNRAKDGSFYWVDTTIVPNLDANGRPVSYVAIRADITARVLATEALAARSAQLARSNAALEEFAYAASHDLQEPLRGVNGCIQILQRNYAGKLDASADEFIRHSVVNIERMKQLILALLDYSRVERSKNVIENVNSAEVLHEVIESLSTVIEESGAQITSDGLPVVSVNRSQLVRLFQNLIANAIKFRATEPARIHVSAQPGDAPEVSWKFSVADNGIGIAPEHADRIFRIFQRLHTRDKYEGAGIGLAICRKIVELHGGRIWVESHPGQGAKFVFTLGKLEV